MIEENTKWKNQMRNKEEKKEREEKSGTFINFIQNLVYNNNKIKLKKEKGDSKIGSPQPDLLLGDVRNPVLNFIMFQQFLQSVVFEGHCLLINE